MISPNLMRSGYPSLTSQVPYLSPTVGGSNERFFFLPFLGGLALGGLLFNNRPCCGYGYGGGGYGYGGGYYPQPYPYYPQPYPVPYGSPNLYKQTSAQNSYYGPYAPQHPNQIESTVVESNKFYLS